MTNFERLAAKATARPWHVGNQEDKHPTIRDRDGRIVDNDPDFDRGQVFANVTYLTIAANYVERLVKSQEWMMEKLGVFIREHPDPGADAICCASEARRLLASIEQAAKGE